MCGIYFVVDEHDRLVAVQEVVSCSCLGHRGPDAQDHVILRLTEDTSALFCGFTLHFRGELTPQPLVDDRGNVLLWNGEIFDGVEVDTTRNDGKLLLELLGRAETETEILTVLAAVHGPWALVYFQKQHSRLWFGRDFFGRRSLLISEDGTTVCLSSVAVLDKIWREVPANGVYCLQLPTTQSTSASVSASSDKSDRLTRNTPVGKQGHTTDPLTVFPWLPKCQDTATRVISLHCDLESGINKQIGSLTANYGGCGVHCGVAPLNRTLPAEGVVSGKTPEVNNCDPIAVETLQNLLSEVTVKNSPPELGTATSVQETRDAVELTAQAREEPSASAFAHWMTKEPSSLDIIGEVNGAQRNGTAEASTAEEEALVELLLRSASGQQQDAAVQLLHVLGEAVKVRVRAQSYLCSKCLQNQLKDLAPSANGICRNGDSCSERRSSDCQRTNSLECVVGLDKHGARKSRMNCAHARTAVLFSGGLDSLVLAALVDRFVDPQEPIDLLNVAFEQQQQTEKPSKAKKNHTPEEIGAVCEEKSFRVPDRQTGLRGLAALNPNRKWNFVHINVTKEELQKTRSARVQRLVYPLNTVLDDSIGCAVWFAARGQGHVQNEGGELRPYNSTARVLLVGMGADEQLMGYSRHWVKFKFDGWLGLLEEVQKELDRISARNLGRDDRIIADHGKEARLPYLDEHVASYLSSLPLHVKADLRLPRGVGEKLLLRLAALRLGLGACAVFPKRAIQFGSRIAKLEKKKEKASDVCDRLAAS